MARVPENTLRNGKTARFPHHRTRSANGASSVVTHLASVDMIDTLDVLTPDQGWMHQCGWRNRHQPTGS